MGIWESLLLALGLCADCFAVSLCSGVTMPEIRWRDVVPRALCFAFIHIILLLAGWAFGELLTGVVGKAARIVAFLLLLYVGGNMLLEGIKGGDQQRRLGSFKDVVLGGLATSIDAAAVGAARGIAGNGWSVYIMLASVLFVVTLVIVSVGLFYGSSMGKRYGKTAEIIGGLVLLFIAFWNLFK